MRLSKLGSRIIEEANNLKRTKDTLAKEINIPKKKLERVLQASFKNKEAQDVIERMLKIYPLSNSKLQISNKEKFNYFCILDKKTSKKSSRIFKRKNQLGQTVNYYEYRDTAMSKNTPIYPEWIKPLVLVSDNNPYNKHVCYNKGHLLHQFTFFIGEVNFYWKDEKGSHCAVMKTGDSNYIPPFIPHSFTSRNSKNLGLIIAVTFADILRFSRLKFSHYKRKEIEEFSGKNSLKLSYFKLFLKEYLNKNLLDNNNFIEQMSLLGIKKNSSEKILSGIRSPNKVELIALSKFLRVTVDFIKNIIRNDPSKVINKKFISNKSRLIHSKNKTFRVWDLAKSNYDNFLKSFIIEVNSYSEKYNVNHLMHEYIYNFGNQAVIVKIYNKKYILKPEESIVLSPMVKHSFRAESISTKLLVIRVSEEFAKNFIGMYSSLTNSSRKRIFSQVSQWF